MMMKTALLLFLGLAVNSFAAVQSSANYSVLSCSMDAGGTRAVSSNYSNDGSLGGFSGLVSAIAPQETARIGYIGKLYEVTALTLTAPATNLNEGASMPLSAVQFLDDGTVSPVSTVDQWSFTGPIAGIDAAGIVTAGNVTQNTPATVQARLEGWLASLNIMVSDTIVAPTGYNQIALQYLGSRQLRLSFVGLAGINYALDRCYNLAPPINWTPQLTNRADANGVLIFTNQANSATNNFWRIRSVP